MERKDIDYLIGKLNENGLAEIEYEDESQRIHIRKDMRPPMPPHFPGPGPCADPAPVMPGAPEGAGAAASGSMRADANSEPESRPRETEGNVVRCPLVGTFYAASSPEAEPFVSVGDKVQKGQVLGIVEAMKLMNEIESEYSGTVKEILVENGQMVQYDQPIFVIG